MQRVCLRSIARNTKDNAIPEESLEGSILRGAWGGDSSEHPGPDHLDIVATSLDHFLRPNSRQIEN